MKEIRNLSSFLMPCILSLSAPENPVNLSSWTSLGPQVDIFLTPRLRQLKRMVALGTRTEMIVTVWSAHYVYVRVKCNTVNARVRQCGSVTVTSWLTFALCRRKKKTKT